MVRQLTHYGQEILRKNTAPVEEFNDELDALIEDMFETMYEAEGIGLAANQVGVDLALATIDISHMDEEFVPFIIANPEILESDGDDALEEGCLSIPGIREVVHRPYYVKIRYQDQSGKTVEREAEDLLARVLQHETDHLNGSFFVDRLSPVKRRFLHRRLQKVAEEGFPQSEHE